MMAEANIKKLPIIIKADAHGSAEAIKSSLEELKNDEVKVNILDSNVGDITENDIVLADAGEINPDNIETDKDKKDFVKLFGEYLKVENILQNYDEFSGLKALQNIDEILKDVNCVTIDKI